jgi:hypothetical protein
VPAGLLQVVEHPGGGLRRVVAGGHGDHELVGGVDRGLPVGRADVVAGVDEDQLVEPADHLADIRERGGGEHLAGRRGLIAGQDVEHPLALRPDILRQVADPTPGALEVVEVAQQVTHGTRVEVELGPHPQGALGLVVVPGQHVPAALLPEGHREHQAGDGLAGAALGVDHGHLPQPAEVAPDQLDVLEHHPLVLVGRELGQAERGLPDGTPDPGHGDRVGRAGGAPPGELLGRRDQRVVLPVLR